MKISELIALLQQAKQEFGDAEIRLYNNQDYWYYPIKGVRLSSVKQHPDSYDILCPTDNEWIGRTQRQFDKQPVQRILYFSTKD